MKNPFERFGRSNPLTLLPVLVLALACAAPPCALAQGGDHPHGDLPHGGLTREAFVTAKSLAAGEKDNNGELGDAATLSERYDVLRYGLDLQIDPTDRSIAGTVTMVFSSTYDGLTEMIFDLRQTLTIDSVAHLSGVLAFTHEGDSVTVQLPAPLAVGAVDSVVVQYGGVPTPPLVNRGLMFREVYREHGGSNDDLIPLVANLSQPGYAQSWWPCKDRPDDKFVMTMELTVPEILTAVSNGTFLGEAPAEPGWRTYRWSEAYPIATYLVSVAISEYVLLSEECATPGGSDIPLRNWVWQKDVGNALIEFENLCPMMGFCEDRFGPYPFQGEKYGHAEFLWNGAMEHQTVTSIGHGSFSPPGTHQWLVMHELAHQWFGDSLTPADWADIWLNEGFATYSEALWVEYEEGTEAYDQWLINHRNEGEWLAQGQVYDPYPVFPGKVIYDKGAWILHVLRSRMGDGSFFAFVEEWADGGDRPLGYVMTQELIDLASQYAGEDLNGMLWPYLEEVDLPQIASQFDTGPGNAGDDTRVTVNLRQVQGRIFDLVFPVEVTTTAGTETRRVHLDGRSVTVDLEFSASVTAVELDPDFRVLWNPAGPISSAKGLYLTYPNPATGGVVTLRYSLDGPSRVVLKILDARGHLIDDRDLGVVDPGAGFNELVWEAHTPDGRRVPSGVYWATLEIDGERSVRKFTLLN